MDSWGLLRNSCFKWLPLCLLFLLGGQALNAFATVIVTAATGGTNLSADLAQNSPGGGEWTSLGNITLTEESVAEFDDSPNSSGTSHTLIIKAATGWRFNSASVPSITIDATGDINSSSVTMPNDKTINITLVFKRANRIDSLTLSGLQVMAIDGGCANTVSKIYVDAASTILLTGLIKGPDGTSLGNLSQSPGNLNRLAVTLPGQTFTDNNTSLSDSLAAACTANSGNSGTISAQIAGVSFNAQYRAVDQFFNVVPTYSGTKTLNYLAPLPLSSLKGTAPTLPMAVSFTNGVNSAVLLTLVHVQMASLGIRDNAGAIQSGVSNVIVHPGVTNNIVVEQTGGGNIGSQNVNAGFNIRLIARDAEHNIVASGPNQFNGNVTLTSNCGLAGSPLTTGSFTAGIRDPQSVTVTMTRNSCSIAVSGVTTLTNTFAVTSVVSSFDVFEASTTGSATTGRIFTKLAGTGFSLAVVAISNGAQVTSFNENVRVELVANTGGAGGGYGANKCPTSMSVIQTINSALISGGRSNVSFTGVGTSFRDVRVRVSYPTTSPNIILCSTDSFSIRPISFSSVASNMNNALSTGIPRAIAGSGTFNLIVTASDSGYNGTPRFENGAIQAHSGAVENGVIQGGPFAAASGGISTTNNAFTYSEVGNFRFIGFAATLGSIQPRGIYDDTFTLVDQPDDCTADFSNVPDAAGKYGCKFGLTAPTAYIGRFYPKDFILTPGTITNRSALSACVSTFTYAGENVLVGPFTLTARNGAASPVTTKNYHAAADPSLNFAAFDGTAIGNFNFAAVDQADTTAPTGATSSAGLPLVLGASSGTWAAGVGTFTATVSTTRALLPNGPFESFMLGIDPVDPVDGDVKLSLYNLSTSNPAGASDRGQAAPATKIRWGRMLIRNTYGSELLRLPVLVSTQYWNSSSFISNPNDNCTPLAPMDFAIAAGTGGAINTRIASTTNTIASGKGTVTLEKPTGFTSKGSIRLSSTRAVVPGVGVETFGVYKSGPVIFAREIY